MLFSSFSCDFTEFIRRAMRCFSCCFRIREDNHTQVNRFSQPITAIRKETVDPLASSCVWSVLAHEDEDEDGDLSRCEDGRYGVTGSPLLDDELRAEAKFLKACGTLPQTPVEIRKNDESKDSQPHNGDTESTFDSRLLNTAFEDALQKQPDQSQSPITVIQKWDNGSESSSHSSSSLKNIDSISSNSSEGCGTLPQTPVEFPKNDKSDDSQPRNGDTESIFDSTNTDTEEALQKQPDQFQSPIAVFQRWENVSDSSSHSSNSLKNTDSISSNSSEGCGTLPETPVEFPKNDKSDDSQPRNGDTESIFDSTNTDTEEALQKQPDQFQSPIAVFQKWENVSDSSSHSSNSLKNIDSISSNSSEGCGIEPAASTHCKSKSVRFKSQSDLCSFSSNNSPRNITKIPLKLCESPFDHTVSKPSPYPTPRKLTDDMQTPGTVFASYSKNASIRVQYVHSHITPRNFSQLDTPIEEECVDQSDKESPQSQVKLEDSTTEKELNVCPTLSSWLPSKSNHEGCIDESLTSQTPGVVTLDWNADETEFTPKWGDGNGIPNTTTKYSEDQKVNWHATPFEERLEKALSEDKFVCKMKQLEETTCVEY
ncbi:putative protein JASON [Helianthus annuus]|uniref:Protein JASON n=1 Tax=Helianthus annuus TaxID=4232 RepID=A0A251SMT0_HELAN|nr:putative protein JASON [Helianthus annuus]